MKAIMSFLVCYTIDNPASKNNTEEEWRMTSDINSHVQKNTCVPIHVCAHIYVSIHTHAYHTHTRKNVELISNYKN